MKGQTISSFMKIVNLEKGHTAAAAEFIQKAVGGELFEIETVKTYKEDHMEMIKEAKEELANGTRVELKGYLEDFDKYDILFIGFPNWWNALPMPVVTFLEHYDWFGKKVIPFCTSQGSGFGNMLEQVKKICAGAEFGKELALRGSKTEKSEKKVADWARQNIV